MTPLQEKILNLSYFYCKYEIDQPGKCDKKVQCPDCKALEEILKKDFSEE